MTFLSALCFSITLFFIFDLFHGLNRDEPKNFVFWTTVGADILGAAFFLWLGEFPYGL